MFYGTDSSDEQSAFEIIICSFIRFLGLQWNELLQSQIKQKLHSFKKITCITGMQFLIRK